MRPRDSLLEAILALKARDARISVNEIVAFLYVCENEGLSVQELAFVGGLTQSTASRSLRSLGRRRQPSAWWRPTSIPVTGAATSFT
jgi:DNA-binding MarR family transcriptional regulator